MVHICTACTYDVIHVWWKNFYHCRDWYSLGSWYLSMWELLQVWNLCMKQCLESIILFQIVVHCLLIVHDIPKAQYLQIPTDEYIPPCRISRTALRKIFLGHISCTRWGNKHFQGGMCVLCLFSLSSFIERTCRLELCILGTLWSCHQGSRMQHFKNIAYPVWPKSAVYRRAFVENRAYLCDLW